MLLTILLIQLLSEKHLLVMGASCLNIIITNLSLLL